MAVDYDLVIIGGGSAGLVAASAGAQLKAKVALVEREDRLGGDCLHYGCVPSKSLIHASRVAHEVSRGPEFGVHTRLEKIDFQAALGHVHRVIDTIQVHDSTERFESLGVEVIYGKGEFTDSRTFTVNGRALKARSYIIATGSRPANPKIEGLEQAGYITNLTVFSLKHQPQSLAVIGAGPIGCELGQAFARLGTEVTLIGGQDHILPKEEPEAAAVVQAQMEKDGVRILKGTRAQRVEVIDGKKHVHTTNGTVMVDDILLAAGRVPNVDSLNLEAAGVAVGKEGITVNSKLQTTNSRIYAAGDVIGGCQFTHVAGYEGAVAMQNALLFPTKTADYRVIPWATFTDPELARVGLTEAQARDRYNDVYVLKQGFDGVDRALAEAAGQGFGKIITRSNGEILGAHLVGPHAGELIHEIVLAMSNNLKVGALTSMIHIYPTLAEVNSKAALQLTKQKYAKNARLQGILSKVFGVLRSWS
ncbi:MAG: NAD(P)/FAD-dependent oxidoreductase [Tildeniella torsiva UHER 1998/13D]|jgi:pyruvate/2-oxoglutarate dehydrogenase complex dihydrolipoamide dehydrogenase (E3) component|nr:NAD(P)/FAD-dependent oxidoreductase [Tildeniella torsiva UHER 1998/13D]